MPPPTMRIRDPTMPTPFQDRDAFDTTGWERRLHGSSRTGIRTTRTTSTASSSQGVAMFRVRPHRTTARHRRGPPRHPRPRRVRRQAVAATPATRRPHVPRSARPASRRGSPAAPSEWRGSVVRRQHRQGRQRCRHRPGDDREPRRGRRTRWLDGPRSRCRSRTSARPWPRCGRPPPPHRASCCPRTSAPPRVTRPSRSRPRSPRRRTARSPSRCPPPSSTGSSRSSGRSGTVIRSTSSSENVGGQIVDTDLAPADHAGQRRAGARLPRPGQGPQPDRRHGGRADPTPVRPRGARGPARLPQGQRGPLPHPGQPDHRGGRDRRGARPGPASSSG